MLNKPFDSFIRKVGAAVRSVTSHKLPQKASASTRSWTRPIYAELRRANPIHYRSPHASHKKSLSLTLSKDRLVLLFTNALLLLNILVGFSLNFAGVQNILGFPLLVLVPGVLTFLLLGIKLRDFGEKIIYSTALGVLFLMLVGLIANYLLPHLGIQRPLDKWPFLISYDVASSALLTLLVVFGKFPTKRYRLPQLNYWSVLLSLAGPFLVLLSVAGAIQLNNGADNYPTMVMLIVTVALLALLIGLSRRLSGSLMLWNLYCIALALLLMTSLRGWYTTGHDIQREFHVFELAKVAGSWDVSRFRDAYNACLSITILPTIFANLLRVSDPFVYKTFFQMIFAFVPVVVYLIARRFVDPALAVLTFIYFVSFPTFFGDMPFLNRQEIAFLFLGLMILLTFTTTLTPAKKKILFLIFALGLIFSHYSTTYITIGILGLAWVLRVILSRFHFRGSLRRLFGKSALLNLSPVKSYRHLITLPIVIAVAAGGFFWSSVLTDTSHGLTTTLTESFRSIHQGFSEDSKSADVLYSLFSFHSVDLQHQLQVYYDKAQKDALKASHPDDFYPPSAYAHYSVKVLSDHLLPVTDVGQQISRVISVEKINFFFRQFQARILQLLIVVGIVYLLFRRSFTKKISTEYLAIAIGSGLIVMAVVVLPFLSVEYGLLRAFQQALMVLGIFIVIGSLAIVPGRYIYKITLASTLALAMMLSSVGIIPQLTGGYYPQLHLNNSGAD